MFKSSLVLLFLLLLSACSSTRLSYGFLDNWLQWRIDDYITLTQQQQRLANKQIKDFHRWHRQTQLTQYSDFIDRTLELIEQETISTVQLEDHLNQVAVLWDNSIEYLLPSSVELLQSLDSTQKEDLLNTIEKRQASARQENANLTLEEKQEKRLERTEKTLKKWLASITPAQQTTLEQWVRQINLMGDARTQRQAIWNQTFTDLLSREDTAFDISAARLVFIDAETLWPANYSERFSQNKALLLDMIVQIHAQLDDTQKQSLSQRLLTYKNDFIYLAGR